MPSTDDSNELRQRRSKAEKSKVTLKPEKGTYSKSKPHQKLAKAKSDATSAHQSWLDTFKILSAATGLCVLFCSGYWFVGYVRTLHDNQLWFSNIAQVEREISLRTECGLYYSYYKQLVGTASFWQGYRDLQFDNATEHGRTINILERFNVFQEVFLAWLHRFWPFAHKQQPILFYVYSIFSLNGLYVGALFALTWGLCGWGAFSWPAGLLSVIFFVVNLNDSSRVFFTVNLRESFGFPIFWCQVLLICTFLRRSIRRPLGKELVLSAAILATTYLFALTWQFSQFVMLVQCGSIYAVGLLHLIPEWQCRRVLLLEAAALLVAGATQFFQPMLLGSLLLAFVAGAAISLYLCRECTLTGGIVTGCLKLIVQTGFTLLLTAVAHFGLKRALQLEADDHIFKFLKGKFGFANPRDFESRVYLCHGAFAFLENDYFHAMSLTLTFPLYMLALCGSLFVMGKDVLSEWCGLSDAYAPARGPYDSSDVTHKAFYFNRRPEVAYLVVQSGLSGLLAMMALRMKYLWTPHMCVLAAVVLGDVEMWHAMLIHLKPKLNRGWSVLLTSLLCTLLSAALVFQYLPKYREQMNDLKEFYDPDTVELMYWIGNQTAPEAAFAGSMQLLAGVKCCTGRHITNHPHFEDKWLRDRTIRVYQVYGRRSAAEVHRALKHEGAAYLILEDSICLARSDGCSLPDLVDLHNGHVPGPGSNKAAATAPPADEEATTLHVSTSLYGLKRSDTPRFCDEVRHAKGDYVKLFKLVMQNRTFRVYMLE